MPFRTLLHTTRYAGRRRPRPVGLFSVDSREEWAAEWDQPARRTEGEVRWGQELVLFVALGARPSSGFEVTIDQVDLCDMELRVHARESQPSGAVLDILTRPVHAVVIPHLRGVESITLIQRVVTSRD
ncbi:hypothetical protein DLJ59_27805 [Micromonospora inaquosa]|uniref:PrcB C-terminal domain-containing protein n=1 Tax=Micromonospora inaquosa TaxID=2203716 RepID=A0A3N9WVN6_9ACTN|nr:hypothetical protein DLJ59_27805 [Micromonospora inaquosa]